jgi:hypothetical protein
MAAARRLRARLEAARRLDLISERRASEELVFERRIEAHSEALAAIAGALGER